MRRYSLYPHLSHGMESPSPHNEEDVLLTNGRLSFANPNYHLDPARVEQGLNSNSEEERRIYQEWFLKELEEACSLTNKSNSKKKTENRASHFLFDVNDMGVDVDTHNNFNTNSNNNSVDNSTRTIRNNAENVNFHPKNTTLKNINDIMARRSLDLTNLTTATATNWSNFGCAYTAIGTKDVIESFSITNASDKPDLIKITENTDVEKESTYEKSASTVNSPTTTKQNRSASENFAPNSESVVSSTSSLTSSVTSADMIGSEKLEDTDRTYSWDSKMKIVRRHSSKLNEEDTNASNESVIRSKNNGALIIDDRAKQRKREEMMMKRRSYPSNFDLEFKEKGVRFAVRSLGWVEINEDDLTPERSSKAVNKCIVDLSLGLDTVMDAVGRWGDGKDLFMDLDEGSLKLIDPENLTVLNTQPIHTIRVWGVGRDNGRERDFAYVARDRVLRKHMCHVFRCDIPARTIANTLRDICKKIMIERSLQQNLVRSFEIDGGIKVNSTAVRPTNLPIECKKNHRRNNVANSISFPTPMEEPKRIAKALYLGSIQVDRASGMDVLNEAIDRLATQKPQNEWEPVKVAVAPSTITIYDLEDEKPLVECRVRYLSFMGIGKDAHQCAFIMHTAQDIFLCHVFHCEPSSGILCKSIEAACKLRYQKCLDAHPSGLMKSKSATNMIPNKSIGATLKSFVESIKSKKMAVDS